MKNKLEDITLGGVLIDEINKGLNKIIVGLVAIIVGVPLAATLWFWVR